jgi:hypothetical protein
MEANKRMANTKTTDAKTKGLYAADWDEQTAIDAGYFFVDVFGVKHGTRPTSPDPAVLNIPIGQDILDAQAALDVANEKRDAALATWQKSETADPGQPAYDYPPNGFVHWGQKKKASPATREELKAAFKEADEDATRARLKLSQAEARRKARIDAYNIALIPEPTPLQKAVTEAQRNRTELTQAEARALGAGSTIEVMGYGS